MIDIIIVLMLLGLDDPSGIFSLIYSVQGDNVSFSFSTSVNGYIGFGPSPGQMIGSDPTLCVSTAVTERFAVDQSILGVYSDVVLDDINNIFHTSTSINNGIFTCHWIRPLISPDTTQDLNILIKNPNTFAWAGPSDMFSPQQHQYRGLIQLKITNKQTLLLFSLQQ